MTSADDRRELAILDGIRMAHDFRHLLWTTWGERSVPRLAILEHECQLQVRGTDSSYLVTISRPRILRRRERQQGPQSSSSLSRGDAP